MKKIFLFILFISILGFSDNGESTTFEYELKNSIGSNIAPPDIIGLHPLTGQQLPTGMGYPFQGKMGDGIKDKIHYFLKISLPDSDGDEENQLLNPVENYKFIVHIDRIQNEEPPIFSDFVPEDFAQVELISESEDPHYILKGVINLPYDINQTTRMDYYVALVENGEITNRFFTQITVNNPTLTLDSYVATYGHISEGIRAESEVFGQVQISFGAEFRSIGGSGPLNYERFEIDTDNERCTFNSTTTDGTWRVSGISFPLSDSLFPYASSSDTITSLLTPNEVIILIEPEIKEKGTLRCAGGIPPVLPFPRLIHYFAVFYSFHGGEIPCYNESGNLVNQPNEMNEDRGGLVIGGWEPGIGKVIAKRSYIRKGKRRKTSFEENSQFELRWDVNCSLDNSDDWTIENQGDYNCLDACETGDCQLEVLVNDDWVKLNKSREKRDIVDEMAGKDAPQGNDPSQIFPSWVRCNCY